MKSSHFQFVNQNNIIKLEVKINKETGVFDRSVLVKFSGPAILLYKLCYLENRNTVTFLYDGRNCFGMVIDIEKNTKESDLELIDILIKQLLSIAENDNIVPTELRAKMKETFGEPLILKNTEVS